MGHLATILSNVYTDITNIKIIVPTIALTSSIVIYPPTNKYIYVCLVSCIVAVTLTTWTYIYFPVPPEAKAPLVGLFLFIINFLTATFWGSATWLSYRYFPLKKGSSSNGG
jgi:hypothetical protein